MPTGAVSRRYISTSPSVSWARTRYSSGKPTTARFSGAEVVTGVEFGPRTVTWYAWRCTPPCGSVTRTITSYVPVCPAVGDQVRTPVVGWIVIPAGFSGRSNRSGSFSGSVAVTTYRYSTPGSAISGAVEVIDGDRLAKSVVTSSWNV